MTNEKLYEALGDIDEKYVAEAHKKEKSKIHAFVKFGAVAACVCVIAGGMFLMRDNEPVIPEPKPVQVVNPIMKVDSAEEMEYYLDYKIPLLDKDVSDYIVLVLEGYADHGRVHYADGSKFHIQYGSGDISGIYGGKFCETVDVCGIEVSLYEYSDTVYGIWETGGFTFSYQSANFDISDIESIIKTFSGK